LSGASEDSIGGEDGERASEHVIECIDHYAGILTGRSHRRQPQQKGQPALFRRLRPLVSSLQTLQKIG
jgi:hypothetical protein